MTSVEKIQQLKLDYIQAKDPNKKATIETNIYKTLARIKCIEKDPGAYNLCIEELHVLSDFTKSKIKEHVATFVSSYKSKVREKKNQDSKQDPIELIKGYLEHQFTEEEIDVKVYLKEAEAYLTTHKKEHFQKMVHIHANRNLNDVPDGRMNNVSDIVRKTAKISKPVYNELIYRAEDKIQQAQNKEKAVELFIPEAIPIDDTRAVCITDDKGEDRPIAIITDEAFEIIKAANKEDPQLFRRGNTISQIVANEHDIYSIEVCGTIKLRSILSRECDFCKATINKRTSDIKRARIDVPKKYAEDLFARTGEGLYPLKGIVEHPIVNEDGSFDSSPGYNKKSEYFIPEDKHFDIIEMEVGKAKKLLQNLFEEFPWKNQKDFTMALSIPLTMLLRPIIDGPTPIHAVLGKTRAGKTLLVQCLHTLVTGKDTLERQPSRSIDEWRKELLAALSEGKELLLYDNFQIIYNNDGDEIPLESGTFASAITSVNFTGRILGINKSVSYPVNCTWAITAHTLSLSKELKARCVSIQLKGKPENKKKYKHMPIKRHIRDNREQYLSALFALIKDWFEKDKPESDQKLDGFEDWAAIVGGVLENAGYTGFLEADFEEEEGPSDEELKIQMFFESKFVTDPKSFVSVNSVIKPLSDYLGHKINSKSTAIDIAVSLTFGIPRTTKITDSRKVAGWKGLKWIEAPKKETQPKEKDIEEANKELQIEDEIPF